MRPAGVTAAAAALGLYYGGTFDPFHAGHLAIARAARDAFEVPVVLLPAADPPHRQPPGAAAADRLHMVELGIAGDPGLVADDLELRRARRLPGRPSYTVDTLRELRARDGARRPIAWLMGADSFAGLTEWHDGAALRGLTHLVLAERAGNPLAAQRLPPALAAWLRSAATRQPRDLLSAPAGRICLLRQPLRPESATAVRAAIAAGEPGWRTLLPPAVAGYIVAHRLYGAG